ncbi:MAG: prenyltransferase [Candidatus Polarisedimenticolaceae bacterium]|nr:prenyltransferase [Candidatus Polarisedimenticolaceae bacterium]
MKQYNLLRALRPFSLAVALISCGLGVLLAWHDGFTSASIALWIILGGVLAQAGINLINDIEDLPVLTKDAPESAMIRRNRNAGVLCLVLAASVALYLVSLRGWPLFVIVFLSTLAALSYNMGPLNFKHRGLGVVQVFLVMGVVMVQGAYLAMSGQFSGHVLLLSLPVSLLISLLLLSNELRDLDEDTQLGTRTLTVRIGYQKSVQLYWLLIATAYLLAVLLSDSSQVVQLLWLLLPLPLLVPIKRLLHASERSRLTPLTGRFFLLFGAAYLMLLSQ